MNSYNEKRLRKAGRSIELPFSLSLEGSDGVLHCESLLRIIPGRRAVFLGKWGKKQVVAKLFYRPLQIDRHLRREVNGTRALLRAGIMTPDLLYVGNARNTAVGVLLFEYIHPASPLEEVWNAIDNTEEKRDLFRQLLLILAKMHQGGLKQHDLHLNNFVMKSHEIYSMDGASIKRNKARHPLKVPESLNNLALLFAQLTLQDSSVVHDLYTDYAQSRGWKITDDILAKLQLKIERWRRRRIRRYVRKLFRESTEIVCRKSFTRFMLCKRAHYTHTMEAFLENPDRLLDKQNNLLLKRGNTCTVGRIGLDDHDLVVKRYNIKSFGHGLRRSVMPTRAAHSWRNAHLLLLLGIPTPRPVAMLEKRFGPFRRKAYFISEYLYGPHALIFFTEGDLHEKSTVARRIADIFKSLKSARISHGDMKATNILIHQHEPVLIDVEGICAHYSRRRFLSAHRKDIKRFFQNWKDLPEVSRMFEKLMDRTTSVSRGKYE
jgi:tRNA A-37 threonylcarbamoyl transferase component Bud32